MNRKKRDKNRENARLLSHQAVTCPECRERGKHWIQWPGFSLQNLLDGKEPSGFWTCAKFYGPDGRRI